MRLITMYVAEQGGTYVQAYYELIDMGEIRESPYLLDKCRKLDRSR